MKTLQNKDASLCGAQDQRQDAELDQLYYGPKGAVSGNC